VKELEEVGLGCGCGEWLQMGRTLNSETPDKIGGPRDQTLVFHKLTCFIFGRVLK
jgi:hypothetical protein